MDSEPQAVNEESPEDPGTNWLDFPRAVNASSKPGAYKYDRDGADFAIDLPNLNVLASEHIGGFSPKPDNQQRSIDNSAYCVYKMRCFRDAETADVSFTWKDNAPAPGTCWIGLSDWEKGCWSWRVLPDDNTIVLDPLEVANEYHQCYIAVIVTDGDPVTLDAVQVECNPDGMVEYTLFPPQQGYGTFLLDHDQNTAKLWVSDYLPNSATYLLENGHVLRTCQNFSTGRGRIEEYDWDLNLVWYFEDFPEQYQAHHDIAPLPNGNILALVEEPIAPDVVESIGRDPANLDGDLHIDAVVEIKPLPGNTGEIVWIWRAFDRLIQDFDPDKDNYGVVGDHPERLDVNFDESDGSDFSHGNAVAYNEDLDQVMINFRSQCEFYIIDHSTTTEEAAGHTGGRYGRGGDFLYRWGNPQVYRQGTADDQKFYKQHDAEWIPADCPGAGHILVYNNGESRPGSIHYSTVDELELPLLADGSYEYSGGAYGPEALVWQYIADPPESVYTFAMGGSQRLPNGDTLICVAMPGVILEVTPTGETVWQYKNTHPYAFGANPVFKAERYYLFGPDFPVE